MKSLKLTILALGVTTLSQAKIWQVTNSGTSFSPSSLTINEGDTVQFSLSQSHNSQEVSQVTWSNNGNTALAGGFSTAFGGGLVLPDKLTQGTHYYVCTPHAGFGMKGQIIVNKPAVGISTDQISSVSIFPNPSHDFIKIKNYQNIVNQEYNIKDNEGKIVLKGKITSEIINIENLSSGIYYLLINDDKKSSIKIIKN